MKFKSITCLTKANKKKSETERNENMIIFNSSKIDLIDNILNLDIQDREIFFLGSSEMIKIEDYRAVRPSYQVITKWVKCFNIGVQKIEVPEDATDILIITLEIYNALKEKKLSDEDIYGFFKKKGLGQMSMELSDVIDFTAMVAQITI